MPAVDTADATAGEEGADDRFTVEDLPWLGGFLAGLGAYVLAYALVGGVFALDLSRTLDLGGGGTLPESTLSYLGWVFYSAQFVTVDVALFSFNLVELAESATALPPVVYYAIAPVVVVGASVLLVRWSSQQAASPQRRAVVGAMVAVGYLPAMVLGAVAVATSEGQPNVALAFLVGLGYALGFGALGGLLAGR